MDISHELQSDHTHFRRRNYVFLTIRLITGFLLTHKGIFFISHNQELQRMVMQTSFSGQVNFLVSYITFAHLLGGVLIMLGLLTRFAVVLQIPIIIGAIIYNFSPNPAGTTFEVILSIVLLILLVVIIVKGGGTISMDSYLKKHRL